MLNRIITDLRERRLWPIVAVLALAIIAVPLVLAKSPPHANPAPAAVANAGTALPASLPSVSADLAPAHSELNSVPHDPFSAPPQPKAASVKSISTATSAGTAATSPAVNPTAAVRGSSGVANSPATATSPPAPVKIPGGHAKPAPAGLGPKQTYDVTLASTVSGGGLSTIDPLERLSPVPSASRPWLVELGVLSGGRQVLFAVLPGTTLNGPGTCIPGPTDCEVLALGVNQIETVAGGGGPATEFGVTAVTAQDHGTVPAARRARTAASAQGQSLLARAGLTAPSLFFYDPRLGALVDLRNLSVGGN